MTNLSKERKRAEGKSVSVPVKSELSRQLCEICGIEPKIIEDYDSNDTRYIQTLISRQIL